MEYLLRSIIGAAPDADDDYEIVNLVTENGSRKRQKVAGTGNYSTNDLDSYRIIAGQFDNADESKKQALSADIPFKMYPIPSSSSIDTNNPNVRAGLVNLKLQLSLTNQKLPNMLETPEYEFSAHYCDLEHHIIEATNAARVAATAIFATHKTESAYEIGNHKVDLFVNQELPITKKLVDYVNADHLQPFLNEVSPCGWELWPKIQENQADVSIDIERHLFDLDPFRTLNEDQSESVNAFVESFQQSIKKDYSLEGEGFIVLTGTDQVPVHYPLSRS